MSFNFSPEVIKTEIENEIKKIQESIKSKEKKIPNLEKQFREIPQPITHQNYGINEARYTKIINQDQIGYAHSFNAGIRKTIESIKSSISEDNSKISNLQKQADLFSREIEERNRKTQESNELIQSKFDNSVLNNLKNINNEVIGQSMQNESFRNKLIIGGLVGVLAIAVMKKR